jgi:hypothetical protein
MKTIAHIISIFMIGVAVFAAHAQTRVSKYGSNPYFTTELFPQDVSLQHSNALSFYPVYCKSPWWGDIDEPNNKPPRAVYTITGSEVSKPPALFKESAKLRTLVNQLAYSYRPNDNLTAKIDFDYTLNALRDRAEGNFTNDTTKSYIPFDYSLRHTLNSYLLKGLFGFSFCNIPVGLNMSIGMENTLALKSEFKFTKDSIDVSTNRALWGWSTVGCNHIFGVRGTEGDAWLQSSYSKGPLYSLDLVAAATLDRMKVGLSLYYKFGQQDNYSWVRDTTRNTSDSIINRNFIGDYVKNNWTRKSHQGTIDLYGNIHWLTGEMFGLHTFFRIDYNGNVARNALADNLDVESDSKELNRGFAIEAAPNLNIKLGEFMHYIDIGLIVQYRYNRVNNTYMRWVGGGRVKTYWDTQVQSLTDTTWEDYSYANVNQSDLGLDLSSMFPVFNSGKYGKLGFGMGLNGNVNFKFKTNYYGTNTTNGSSNDFNVQNRRENYDREIVFNSLLMLDYYKNRYTIRFEVQEPILRSLMTSTRITDAKGHSVGPYDRKEPLWLTLHGLQAGIFISRDLQLRFLKYASAN